MVLAARLCPEAIPIEMPYDRIGAAVAAGELEAGVMIHEELLYYPQLGLRRVVDLGADWCRRHELPLPVGLNVIRRDLGSVEMQRICTAIRRSLEFGLDHADEALSRVSRLGRGAEGGCTEASSPCSPTPTRFGCPTMCGPPCMFSSAR